MKKSSAKRVSSLPSTAEFNLGGLYHALRIATVRSSDSLWVLFDKEGKYCKVIHSPTQPQYIETICCLLYTNNELNTSLRIDPSRASRLASNTAHVPEYFTNKFLADNIFKTFSLNVRDRFLSRFTNEQHEFFRQLLVELVQKIPKNSESAYLAFSPLISLQKFLCSVQKSYIVLGKDHHQTLRLLLSVFEGDFYIGQTVSQRQMHFPLWLQVTTQ